MAAFLSNLRNVVIAGFVLALIVLVIHWQQAALARRPILDVHHALAAHHLRRDVDRPAVVFQFRLDADDAEDSRRAAPALGKYITPAALFWFRWGAMGTIVFGIILASLNGYLLQAYTLDSRLGGGAFSNPTYLMIGIGMWLRHDHVVQRLVRHLAEPAEGAEHRQQISRPFEGGEGRSAKTAGSSRASTRCSRFPCCSAWRPRRICPESAANVISKSRPGNRAALLLVDTE
jgi:hypothetical protein